MSHQTLALNLTQTYSHKYHCLNQWIKGDFTDVVYIG